MQLRDGEQREATQATACSSQESGGLSPALGSLRGGHPCLPPVAVEHLSETTTWLGLPSSRFDSLSDKSGADRGGEVESEHVADGDAGSEGAERETECDHEGEVASAGG